MTKSIWTGACSSIIVGAAVAAMAQTPAAPAAQQSASTSADQKIVVTGCLKAATPAGADATATTGTTGTSTAETAGTAGTTGTTDTATPTDSAAAKFVLADAIISPAKKADTGSAPGTAETTAAAGTSSAGGAPQTYALIANGLALREHVGKKLELTGTVVNQPASTSAASTPATAAGPALKVESGKVIAASCQ